MSEHPLLVDGVSRVPVTRVLEDETREPGGSALLLVLGDEWGLSDFRGPDGEPWPLPPGASFDVEFSLPFPLPGVEVVEVDPPSWWERLREWWNRPWER